MRVAIHVHDERVEEMGVVILRGQLQLLAAYRDIESGAQTGIDGSFLTNRVREREYATGGQDKRIVSDSIRRSITHSGTGTHRPPLERRITHVRTRRHKETVFGGVIRPHTGHERELVAIGVIVFGEDAGRYFPTVQSY